MKDTLIQIASDNGVFIELVQHGQHGEKFNLTLQVRPTGPAGRNERSHITATLNDEQAEKLHHAIGVGLQEGDIMAGRIVPPCACDIVGDPVPACSCKQFTEETSR